MTPDTSRDWDYIEDHEQRSGIPLIDTEPIRSLAYTQRPVRKYKIVLRNAGNTTYSARKVIIKDHCAYCYDDDGLHTIFPLDVIAYIEPLYAD